MFKIIGPALKRKLREKKLCVRVRARNTERVTKRQAENEKRKRDQERVRHRER